MALNKAMFKKVITRLRRLRHEKHYDQDTWAEKTKCGTAACIAGHVVMLSNEYKAVLAEDNYYDCYTRDGKLSSFFTAGKRLLGLTDRQSGIVFDSAVWWPEEYSNRWLSGRERQSRVAADFLEAIMNGEVKL